MSGALRIAVATALVAALTWMVGWWAVVPVALLAGALPPRLRAGGGAMAAAGALAWALLLARQATHPAFATLLHRVGGVLQLPGAALLLVALLYAALLGWSGATAGAGLARLLRRERREAAPDDAGAAAAPLRYDSAEPARPEAAAEPQAR